MKFAHRRWVCANKIFGALPLSFIGIFTSKEEISILCDVLLPRVVEVPFLVPVLGFFPLRDVMPRLVPKRCPLSQ